MGGSRRTMGGTAASAAAASAAAAATCCAFLLDAVQAETSRNGDQFSWHSDVRDAREEDEAAEERTPPPPGTPSHIPGGLPMITDAAFSLVILFYVSIAFCFVFFMFCWKTESSAGGASSGLKRQCILMGEAAAGLADPVIIPPTPPNVLEEKT